MINRGLSILLHTLCLGFTLLIFWFLLSGYFEILLILLGVVSVLTILWIANRMDKIDHEGHPIHLTLRTILYWPWLFKEIIITNIEVARIIISRDMPLTLSIIKIRSTQKTELGQVVYGNSITLTPGTVTLGIDKDIITVHSLTLGTAFDLKSGNMDRRITNIEAKPDSFDPLVQTTIGEIK